MAETTPKAPAPKKATAKSTKAGAVDAKAEVKKAEPKKTVTKKVAPAAETGKTPAAVKKAPVARKSTAKKAPTGEKRVNAEQRYRMIAEAAYYRAESRQFKGDPVRDWIEAERDIAILLSEGE